MNLPLSRALPPRLDTGHASAALAAPMLVLALVTLQACDKQGEQNICLKGTAGVETATSVGAECDPNRQYEGCSVGKRLRCSAGNGKWTLQQVCQASQVCIEAPRGGSNTFFNTSCCDGKAANGADGHVADADLPDAGLVDAGAPDTGPQSGTHASDPVCKRWIHDRADLSEGDYTGSNFSQCTPGVWSKNGHTNALRVLNLYRFLAGLPEVTATAALDAKAQACAFLMAANDKLSHSPDASWNCYTDVARDAASKSNISSAPAVLAIDRYMVDEGDHNKASLGHRRWLLSTQLGPVGIGSTGGTKIGDGQASCVWIDGESTLERPWVTWPPAGKVPLQALSPYGVSIDSTGWSILSETVDPAKAYIKVTSGGESLPVQEWRTLTPKLGSKYGLAFQPSGWTVAAGHTYTVEISDVDEPLTWSFTVLDCGE